MASRFALTALPRDTGVFSNTAYSMPGRVMSMPNIRLTPDDIFRFRANCVVVPMIL